MRVQAHCRSLLTFPFAFPPPNNASSCSLSEVVALSTCICIEALVLSKGTGARLD